MKSSKKEIYKNIDKQAHHLIQIQLLILLELYLPTMKLSENHISSLQWQLSDAGLKQCHQSMIV